MNLGPFDTSIKDTMKSLTLSNTFRKEVVIPECIKTLFYTVICKGGFRKGVSSFVHLSLSIRNSVFHLFHQFFYKKIYFLNIT